MRRILLVLSLTAVMATIMVASAMPAFAAPGGNNQGQCGLYAQGESVTSQPPGAVGEGISQYAQQQNFGDLASQQATASCAGGTR